jgi:hypothetical protein
MCIISSDVRDYVIVPFLEVMEKTVDFEGIIGII